MKCFAVALASLLAVALPSQASVFAVQAVRVQRVQVVEPVIVQQVAVQRVKVQRQRVQKVKVRARGNRVNIRVR